jgi:hypothetical protein
MAPVTGYQSLIGSREVRQSYCPIEERRRQRWKRPATRQATDIEVYASWVAPFSFYSLSAGQAKGKE